MQYRKGTVSVTNGSTTITGDTQFFTEEVVPGDLFTIVDSGITQVIASVTDNLHFELTAPYTGLSLTGQLYVIARDFTPAIGLPYPQKGDIETATIYKTAFLILDSLVNFNTLITSPVAGQALVYNGANWVNDLITAFGTITSGTWHGSTIGVGYGGTGLTSTPSNGQLPIGNGSGYTLAALTAGTGVSVTNGSGSITVANTGVTSITGTANQVIASASTGAITLSLPQSIATSSTPTFAQVTLSNSPSNATDAATKAYVDSVAQGLDIKPSVRALASANVTVSNPGTSTFDGVSLTSGDRLLLTGQSTGSQNGIWVFNGSSSALTRPSDFTGAGPYAGSTVFVSEGTTYGNTTWVLTTDDPITVNTTALVWAQFGGAGTYTAGANLTLTGTLFAVDLVDGAHGGTGVNNSGKTITLGGNLVTSGANSLTLTTTGATNVTLPTSGTLVNTAVTTLSSLASIGTITTGVWGGTAIAANKGGTGLTSFTVGDIFYANSTSTIAKLAIGSPGDILVSGASIPAWTNLAGSIAGFGNPTNTVGLTAINGVATTVMRSDAAPAIDQSIAPTWTGIHTFSNTTDSSSTATGTLRVAGGAGIAKKLYVGTELHVGTDASISGDLGVSGYTSLDWVGVSGSVEISGTNPGFNLLSTGGQQYAFNYNSGSGVVGFYDLTGSAWRMYIANTTGVVTFPTNVASTSTSTGSLVVAGGVGVGGNVSVAGVLRRSLNNAVAAAGTTQGAATAITKSISVVSSGTGGSATGVILPVPANSTESQEHVICNDTAIAISVYPNSGGSIDALSTNAAFSLPVGTKLSFFSTSTTKWRTLNATYA
jgi:hypothetical protein